MAKLDEQGRVISDDGCWLWNPSHGVGGGWDRIAESPNKPGLVSRLLVKKSAQGKPGFKETMQAGKLQPATWLGKADAKLRDAAERQP